MHGLITSDDRDANFEGSFQFSFRISYIGLVVSDKICSENEAIFLDKSSETFNFLWLMSSTCKQKNSWL